MTPDRWAEVERLYHAALMRALDERAAFLEDACSGDDALRREVESLLAQEPRAAGFLSTPAVVGAGGMMAEGASLIGSQLGPYVIRAQIGAGGMGVVYRARDTKLGRDVALKVLPDAFASDQNRLARFQREAKTLASLNHPNIGGIHGLEEANGVTALVLELVEGPTLAERIAAGPIPLDEALPIAKQIAEALEAAHDKGIVHRDLKPSNIKVRDDGTVKVLDFGLAKLHGPPESGHDVDLTSSPTITSPALTRAGVIMGTAAYMSPEQARGQPADTRSDIWAFGCVLYETLTGKAPFGGEAVSDVLAAVLRAEPDWRALPDDLPGSIVLLLQRCLEKDRARRIADASVVKFLLNEPSLASPRQPAVADQKGGWRRRHLAALGAAGIVGALAAGVSVWLARPDADPPRVTQFTIPLPEMASLLAGTETRATAATLNVAVSPDGSRVVYTGGRGTLFLRALDALDAMPLSGLGDPLDPFFSPDGQWIGFFNENASLEKVAVTGGPSTRVAGLGGSTSRGAAWSEDGTIVFATTAASGLQMVSAAGGEPAALTTPNRAQGEGDHVLPQFLPGRRGVLFTILPATGELERAQVAVVDLISRTYKVIVPRGSHARYLPTGHLVYAAGGALLAVPFDLDRLEASASPSIPVLSEAAGAVTGTFSFDVAKNGTLVYVAGRSDPALFRLVWVDRQGREEELSAPPRAYLYPRLSPDGTRVALDIRDQGNDIWLWDLARETLSRVTVDPGLERFPLWTTDGQSLIFSSDRDGGQPNVFTQVVTEVGRPQRLLESPRTQDLVPMSVSKDGRHIVIRENIEGRFDLSVMTPADSSTRAGPAEPVESRVRPLFRTPFIEPSAVLSPDDKWLAYGSDESGRFEIYVGPFPDVDAGRSQVSTAGGSQPLWSRDGRELFFFAATGELMAVQVGRGPTWTASLPSLVVPRGYFRGNFAAAATYDVSPDGKRFLMIKREPVTNESATARLVVVLNWTEELKRLVPTR